MTPLARRKPSRPSLKLSLWWIFLAEPAHSAPTHETVQAALETGNCNLCHTVPDHPNALRQDSCHTCHTWILNVSGDPARRERAMDIFPLWERYEQNVVSYLQVPSLPAAMDRLDPEWIASWLDDPHDLRPALPEGMPRFQLDSEERHAIAALFVTTAVPETPAPDPQNIDTGKALFSERGCLTCHSFGATLATGVWPMAPDLAHTRDRMRPNVVAAWIEDPATVSASATMPNFGLTTEESIVIRDYLLLSDPGGQIAAPLSNILVPTTEPVTWDMVESQVFGKICVHCHMNETLNQGRTGPGNGGGFGWEATGIELQTLEGVRASADRIPDALLRRREEAHRDVVNPGEIPAQLRRPTRPGMPLGLPPLSDEEISMVLGWIEQGMPE